MPVFQYHERIVERFPQVVGGVIHVSGVQNATSPQGLLDAYATEQQATLTRIGDTSLGDLPTVAAWRRTFSAFGVSPTRTRSAAEALLRRLTKKGDIPSINTLVDLGNLVSIRYALPVAIFDIRSLNGALTVRFAEGDERFTELGSDEIKHPEVGEVIFADDTSEVYARRWCWRQSIQSAARLDTSEIFVTVEAQHDEGRDDIANAVADLQSLLGEYAGGTQMQAAVLSNNRRVFDAE